MAPFGAPPSSLARATHPAHPRRDHRPCAAQVMFAQILARVYSNRTNLFVEYPLWQTPVVTWRRCGFAAADY